MSDGRLFVTDERAVTPVVSTILMVAIVVVLGAIISVTILGIASDTPSPAPQASFSAEQDTTRIKATGSFEGDFYVLEITHTNGDNIPKDQLNVRVNGRQAWGVNTASNPSQASALLSDSSSSFRAGETLTVVHKDDPSITINEGDGYVTNIPPFYNPVDYENDPEENRLFHSPNHPGGPQLQLEPGDRITIVWESERGDETAVLFEREIVSFN